MRWKVIIIFIVTLLISSSAASALPYRSNHPELTWRMLETEHFQVIFYQGAEKLAEETARVAEEVYPYITSDLGVEIRKKTPIVIADYDDYSNGFANALGHYIFIWSYGDNKDFTSRMTWLRMVVAHEFAHIATFYAVRDSLGQIGELYALANIPQWFMEGVAQYEAETWNVHRGDMLLRTATLERELLPFVKLSNSIASDLIDGRLIYDQGHSLVRYISARFGKDKIRQILANMKKTPWSFDQALEQAIGWDQRELYSEWKRDISSKYRLSARLGESSRSPSWRKLSTPIKVNSSIRWSPDGTKVAVAGFKNYDDPAVNLYVAEADLSQWRGVAFDLTSSQFSWSPDGKSLVYSGRSWDRYGSLHNDLYVVGCDGKNRRRLTKNLRASDPDWSPDGTEIACIVYQGGMTDLALINSDGTGLKFLTQAEDWLQCFSPRWSPDGTKIAFSIVEDNKGDLALFDIERDDYRKLTSDEMEDRYPEFSPEGKYMTFISYRSGVPNLYQYDLDEGRITQLTDIRDGAILSSAWNPRREEIAVTYFKARRTDIYLLKPSRGIPFPTTPAINKIGGIPPPSDISEIGWETIQPYEIEETALSKPLSKATISPYNSLNSVRSTLILPLIEEDEEGMVLGVSSIFSDPLDKHSLNLDASYGLNSERLNYSLSYSNTQFLPTLTLDIFGWGAPLRYGGIDFEERRRGIAIGSDWQFYGTYTHNSHQLSVGVEVINISADPLEDPWGIEVTEGYINTFKLAWGWGSYSPPDENFSLEISYERADKWLGSNLEFEEYTLAYNHYFDLGNWQSFTLKVAGGLHEGDEIIQDELFSVGMYQVRGLERTRQGSRFMIGSGEYGFRLSRELGINLLLLYLERLNGALFLDIGDAWREEIDEFDPMTTIGFELKNRAFITIVPIQGIPITLRGGLAWKINSDEIFPYYVISLPLLESYL